MKNKSSLFLLIPILGLILVSLDFALAPGRLSTSIGNFKSFKTTTNGVLITADNAFLSLSVYAPDIVRVRASQKNFGWDFSYAVISPPLGRFAEIKEEKDRLLLATEKLLVIVKKKPVRIQFSNKQGKILNEDDPALGITWLGTEVTCYKRLWSGERFIGLGEKTGPLDRRGRAYENWNTDYPYYGLEADPLYTTLPFFMGIHSSLFYGIFLDNSSKTYFNFGASTDDRFSSFAAACGEMNYYFFGAPSVAEIIEDYTYLTGRMKMPPLWILGYQQCRWSYFPDSEVLTLARTFREKKIPADVIYLDIHYMDNYKIFTWNPERFPKPEEMIARLKEFGFHVVVIVDPGIKVEKGYSAYEDGVNNGYFIRYPDKSFYTGNVWPGRCHFPDFTNPKVREWWGKQFIAYVDKGVEGFWNDMNEPAVWGQRLPEIVEFDFEGQKTTLKEARNVFGMQMARATYEGVRSLMKGKRPFVLSRAGYSGIQRYSALWTGDNVPSDDHLLLGVRLVNSLGISGVALAGPDIGGFGGDPSAELFARWVSIGAFTPFFRNHSAYGTKDKEPWAFGEEIENLAKKYICLRYQLLPYIYSAFYKTTQTGLPVARTLAIDYPFEAAVYRSDFQNQYFFGDSLLVIPAKSSEKFIKAFLPAGVWYRLSNDDFFQGGQEVIIPSELADLPVFVKGGGMIPMQSIVQSTSEKPSEVLQFHLYSGPDKSSFLYYEDDGITYACENGDFYKRLIEFDPQKKQILWQKPEGNYPTKFKTLELVFHGFEQLEEITINQDRKPLRAEQGKPKIKKVAFSNLSREISINW